MQTRFYDYRIGSTRSTAAGVVDLFVHECACDLPRVAIPQPDVHLVVRLGPSVPNGIDVHAMGIQQEVRRKVIRGGQRTVFARLQLSTCEAVLGMPGAEVAGRVVALGELWGDTVAQRLLAQLAEAADTAAVAAVLENAIAQRIAMADLRPSAQVSLASHAAQRLGSGNVTAVASGLAVSERHLRRVFRQAVGVSPKTFARLTRFHHALSAARTDDGSSWASIAATAGYYDQAHLIAEFRAIAGTTPSALLAELQATG